MLSYLARPARRNATQRNIHSQITTPVAAHFASIIARSVRSFALAAPSSTSPLLVPRPLCRPPRREPLELPCRLRLRMKDAIQEKGSRCRDQCHLDLCPKAPESISCMRPMQKASRIQHYCFSFSLSLIFIAFLPSVSSKRLDVQGTTSPDVSPLQAFRRR